MTRSALIGARILSAQGWLDDHALILAQGRIDALVPVDRIPADAAPISLASGMLLPGFIDTQVNGGGGILFNDHPTVEGIRAIAAAHRAFGTTGLLPTLISDDLNVIAQGIHAVDEAIAQGVPGILGIHIEGPFLNTSKRGIHDASKFRRIDAAAIDLLSSLRRGRILVTLAPELADHGLISALTARGVIVAAGHSLATYEDMQRARGEGLSGLTHLFNAMTPLEGRTPGMVGAALEGGLISGIIVDGHHVHPASLRVAYAALGKEALMLVTDAMPTVGATSKSFSLGATQIMADGGALRSADGTLAGSDLDMASAVKNATMMMGVDLAAASHMASATPARFMGQQTVRGAITPGLAADLVHIDAQIRVLSTWIGGDRQSP
jgi:N-acetylglucosamine-6-phosphate deacetylase